MQSSLLASVVLIEFQTREAYLSFDLINVKYNIYKEPREEKEKVIVWTRPSNFIQWDKYSHYDYGSGV
jgi:hypothetical protein